MSLIVFLIVGFLAGLLARAIFPGNQSMGWVATTALGIVGSFVGGALGSVLRSNGRFLDFSPSGLIWSIIGALIVLAIASATSTRFRTR
jgi:uncharacterized membrane protein YeaQ/YmgE (transglycosylase-associated protein family)